MLTSSARTLGERPCRSAIVDCGSLTGFRQLRKLNEALKGMVSVVIDERDQELLDKADERDGSDEAHSATVKQVKIEQQVRY